MADQALSSVTNFALSVFVARAVTPHEFGVFGLVFAAYLLLLNFSRALGSQPMIIRFAAAEPDAQREAVPGAAGSALVVGVAATAIVGIIAAFLSGGSRASLLALAITLPGLLLQDTWRFIFFAIARPAAAAVNDGVWAGAQFIAFGALYAYGVRTAAPYVFAWGLAATIAAAWGLVQAHALPGFPAGIRWLKAHRDIGPMLSLEFFATSATGQLTLFCVAPFAGLDGVASLRAAQVALGPLTILYAALLIVASPELARLYVRDPDRMARMAMLVGTVCAAAAAAVGIGVYFLPDSLGEAFLRDNWLPAHSVIIPSAIAVAFAGLMSGPFLQMRVIEAVKETLTLRVGLLIFGVAAATIGAILWQAKGSMWALAIVTGIFTWLSWLKARNVLALKKSLAAEGAGPTRPTNAR